MIETMRFGREKTIWIDKKSLLKFLRCRSKYLDNMNLIIELIDEQAK